MEKIKLAREKVEELLAVLKEIKKVEQWFTENFKQSRHEEEEVQAEPLIQEPPTSEINYSRLTSFLDYDNSFFSPWNFNTRLDDAEREREKAEENRRRRSEGSFECDHVLQDGPSRVCHENATNAGDDHAKEFNLPDEEIFYDILNNEPPEKAKEKKHKRKNGYQMTKRIIIRRRMPIIQKTNI